MVTDIAKIYMLVNKPQFEPSPFKELFTKRVLLSSSSNLFKNGSVDELNFQPTILTCFDSALHIKIVVNLLCF